MKNETRIIYAPTMLELAEKINDFIDGRAAKAESPTYDQDGYYLAVTAYSSIVQTTKAYAAELTKELVGKINIDIEGKVAAMALTRHHVDMPTKELFCMVNIECDVRHIRWSKSDCLDAMVALSTHLTLKEAREAIGSGQVTIDGEIIRDYKTVVEFRTGLHVGVGAATLIIEILED